MILEGGCTCGSVRYRMTSQPMFVHCCHCRWCQRETGASFALNALIEVDRVLLLTGEPEIVSTPSNSGKGQKIARAPNVESPCGAIMPERGMRCTSYGWARSMSRIGLLPISTFIRCQSSHG